MATPTFLKYLPARLKPLSSPVVWAPLTIFALLSVFLWEYHKNPEWFNRQQITNANPNSELTPEEQARLSQIDTIDVLLENTRIPGAAQPAELGKLDVPELNGEASDRSLASRDNPFAAYEEEYQFPGSGKPAAESSSLTLPSSNTSLGNTPAIATPATDSALAEALKQQNAASAGSSSNSQTGARTGSRGSSAAASPAALPTAAGNSAFGASEFAPSSAPSNGISAPFTQTTTDMSPPVGTTGYQTPASAQLPVFNTPSQQPTRNPFNTRAQPAIPQSGAFQPVAPVTAPLPGAATPNSNSYTPPRFAQPEQNRRVR